VQAGNIDRNVRIASKKSNYQGIVASNNNVTKQSLRFGQSIDSFFP